jgi:hypothetical protein
VITILSRRAQTLLQNPRFFLDSVTPGMMKYSEDELWCLLELEDGIVKNLSFAGTLKAHQKVFIESLGSLLLNRPLARLDDLTLRECEAFLRDRNSEPSMSGLSESDEVWLRKIFNWVRHMPLPRTPKKYHFSQGKGSFEKLKLVEKIQEIKAFLNSPEVLDLYQGYSLPELVDVEDLSVFIHAPYETSREKELFQRLHDLGGRVFSEERLNFIPEP